MATIVVIRTDDCPLIMPISLGVIPGIKGENMSPRREDDRMTSFRLLVLGFKKNDLRDHFKIPPE